QQRGRDGQRTFFEGDAIVAAGGSAGEDVVTADAAGRGGRRAQGNGRRQAGRAVVVDKAAIAGGQGRIALAVDLALVLGGDGQRGFRDGQRTLIIGHRVVGQSRPGRRGRDVVAADVAGGSRRRAISCRDGVVVLDSRDRACQRRNRIAI